MPLWKTKENLENFEKNVVYFQKGNWKIMDDCGLSNPVWMEAYMQSMSWAMNAVRAMREQKALA